MSTKTYYELDKNGHIIGQFDSPPPKDLSLTIAHTTPPPQAMLKPSWVGDTTTGTWVDAATRAEQEDCIDGETDAAIQNWAREKGKNEAYYINCGIRVCINKITDTTNIDYRHYHEYRAYVDAQKKLSKAKKDALP